MHFLPVTFSLVGMSPSRASTLTAPSLNSPLISQFPVSLHLIGNAGRSLLTGQDPARVPAPAPDLAPTPNLALTPAHTPAPTPALASAPAPAPTAASDLASPPPLAPANAQLSILFLIHFFFLLFFLLLLQQ